MKRWNHGILLFLLKNYTAFDVYINPFLESKYNISASNGNHGRKVFICLKELREKNLIFFNQTDHSNLPSIIMDIDGDNESITLQEYRFHARLTVDGLEYAINLKRERRKYLLTMWTTPLSVVFALLAAIISILNFRLAIENSRKVGAPIVIPAPQVTILNQPSEAENKKKDSKDNQPPNPPSNR